MTRILSGRADRGEIIRLSLDPFNGRSENAAELRSCPPPWAWRVIDGGRQGKPPGLNARQVAKRRKEIDLVRRLYDRPAADRLERALVAEMRGAGSSEIFRRGRL